RSSAAGTVRRARRLRPEVREHEPGFSWGLRRGGENASRFNMEGEAPTRHAPWRVTVQARPTRLHWFPPAHRAGRQTLVRRSLWPGYLLQLNFALNVSVEEYTEIARGVAQP